MNPELLLYIFRLILAGVVSFLAILIMSKTRDAAWMTLVAGFLMSFAALVFELMVSLGVLADSKFCILGIPFTSLCFYLLPGLCFVAAFVLKLLKK